MVYKVISESTPQEGKSGKWEEAGGTLLVRNAEINLC